MSLTAANTTKRIVIVSGLSGSGKSVALHRLEDLGYYCIDNIPATLLAQLIEQLMHGDDPMYRHLAIGLDARNKRTDLAAIPEQVKDLNARGIQAEILFLTTDDQVLIKRYSESRRRHPLSSNNLSLEDAIDLEREMLAPLSHSADIIFDTTRTSVHDLRDLIAQRVYTRLPGTMSLLFKSFGFKYGVPTDAEYVFDVRCLPNPYWDQNLRQYSGLDQPVIDFLGAQELVLKMQNDITTFLSNWIPQFVRNNRSYLTIAIGCTGGHHRSVYLAERLAEHFSQEYAQVLVRHSELSNQNSLELKTNERFFSI
ncbi:MAG: RNase adapter RapZ [Gammaproteobacteria bacterium]|nr:RNase adapter RapZ [Gammaproteobacteria bacterium]NNC97300.1 RNase adapter RapZ [Gammaproteobacteria bacterium]NNM14676.1 RNase adapter RapZ [Gammaproteobacteria bacterium]